VNRINKEIITRIDAEGMFRKIKEFPEQLRKGWEIAENTEANVEFSEIQNIVFAGMGGSAISGDLIHSVYNETLSVPMFVNRGYQIPGFVNSKTLFIASSYSGNTEETLSATEQAVEKGARIICITSGGQLEQIAQKNGYPRFQLIPGYPPRAALGFGLGVLFHIFRRLGIGEISRQDIDRAALMLTERGRIWSNVNHQENSPLDVAGQFFGKVPLIHASVDRLEFVGYRWKTQLNENSKAHAFFQPFPEMNHNEIVGWEKMKSTKENLARLVPVVLSDSEDHPQILKRMQIFKEIMKEDKNEMIEIVGKGDTFFERMVDLIYFGDWVSYYLAILNWVDPTKISKIDLFKKRLTEKLQ
jgi:glucose/mannose-6-phosphate isomerase